MNAVDHAINRIVAQIGMEQLDLWMKFLGGKRAATEQKLDSLREKSVSGLAVRTLAQSAKLGRSELYREGAAGATANGLLCFLVEFF